MPLPRLGLYVPAKSRCIAIRPRCLHGAVTAQPRKVAVHDRGTPPPTPRLFNRLNTLQIDESDGSHQYSSFVG